MPATIAAKQITLARRVDRRGRKDEWLAVCEWAARPGIGHTRDEALASLVRANLGWFGVARIADVDPDGEPEVCVWTALRSEVARLSIR